MLREDWIFRRGDVYLANLNPYFGSEQGGIRPVLTLQNNTGNFYCPMVLSQGWVIGENNELVLPKGVTLKMFVPTQLLPVCPVCGKPLTMNLRSDNKFVEDEGWHQAAERYETFLRTRGGKVLFMELGVGYNTPVIIKYPFWQMTAKNPAAVYACINYGEAVCPEQIRGQSICIDGDMGKVIREMGINKGASK